MANKDNIRDPRYYMEMAVKVMVDSVDEPREDNKASPMVGAVLVKPDGTVETACRGELRYGDHAEFTLLERKNRSKPLDDSLLFATLEPCAPGARSHPKLGCAERIVNARIKEVWVGITDPDPKVDRKGLKYLEKHGITVHLFDRDLQQIIEKENKEFLKQALQRAEEDLEEELPTLNEIENPVATATFEELSTAALERYVEKARLPYTVDGQEFHNYLRRKGIMEQYAQLPNGQLSIKPTGVGLILFGTNPRETHEQAVLKASIKYGDGDKEIQDFDSALITVPEEVEKWLKKVLHSKISRDSFERTEEYAYPVPVLREAIINAIVHRDYDNTAAKTYVDIDDEKIVVKSPGLPIEPLTLEDLKAFQAPSLSRNPKITHIFNQMRLMEERGIGMETLKSLEDSGLPLPSYSYKAPYLTLTFPRGTGYLKELIGDVAYDQLNEEEKAGLFFVRSRGDVSKREYKEHFDLNDKKAQRHLLRFKELKLVKLQGKGPASRYVFNNESGQK